MAILQPTNPERSLFFEIMREIDEEYKWNGDCMAGRNHSRFGEILEIGPVVISIIMDELDADRPSWLYYLILENLTKVRPWPPTSAGKFDDIQKAWQGWWEVQKIIEAA